MIKKIGRVILATVMAGNIFVTTALAAPSVDQLKENKSAAEREAKDLQQQLTDISKKITKLEADLVKTGEKIQVASKDLDVAKKKEEKQYEDMKLRIKYMYEESESSVFTTLLESNSLRDFVNRAQYVNEVHKYDRKQLSEYVKTKDSIEKLKKELEDEQANQMKTQKEFEEQRNRIDILFEAKQGQIKDLEGQLQEAMRKAAEEQARREAEARRQAEERRQAEARRQEEQRRAQSQQNNTVTTNKGNTSTYVPKGDGSVASAIVSAAYSQLGVPYVWGGTRPGSGLDCSGLTQFCHRSAGISIARTSGPQGCGGVSVSNPQPGDIVCYPGHVGIYIGGGKMIHAPQPGEVVKVASVYGSPWYRRYW